MAMDRPRMRIIVHLVKAGLIIWKVLCIRIGMAEVSLRMVHRTGSILRYSVIWMNVDLDGLIFSLSLMKMLLPGQI